MDFPKEPRVAVIGAGISGVVAAAHLIKAGLDVTIFERAPVVGGIWVYDERPPSEPFYPATKPSQGERIPSEYLRLEDLGKSQPGPCYMGLQNNVSTQLLELTLGEWPKGTPDFVSHHVMKRYIQDISQSSGVTKRTRLNASVNRLEKAGSHWQLEWSYSAYDSVIDTTTSYCNQQIFDAVVVTTGHYHAPRVPDIPGLSDWKRSWPARVTHSKGYRSPERYENKNVLLIGAGVSSMDIAKETAPLAKHVFQSFRSGSFDLPASMLPGNATRVGEVTAFEFDANSASKPVADHQPLPFDIILKSGQRVCGIDQVIICTGYHISLPFLSQLHADEVAVSDASSEVLVTDGTQYHNLHKDIFYIPDPSLAFVGVPYYTATFTLFEFQAVVLAAVFSGRASLPSKEVMRDEYTAKLVHKGPGKGFHSLRGIEENYVDECLEWINQEGRQRGFPLIIGHTPKWKQAKTAQREIQAKRFANVEPVDNDIVGAELSVWAAC